jgi:hypothetical protein
VRDDRLIEGLLVQELFLASTGSLPPRRRHPRSIQKQALDPGARRKSHHSRHRPRSCAPVNCAILTFVTTDDHSVISFSNIMAHVTKFVIEAENKRVLLLLILPSFWKNGRTAWLILLSQPPPSHSNTKSRNGVSGRR